MVKFIRIIALSVIVIVGAAVSLPAQADNFKYRNGVYKTYYDDNRACKDSFPGWINDQYGQVCIQYNGDAKLTSRVGNVTHTHIYDASLFNKNIRAAYSHESDKKYNNGKHKGHYKQASIKRENRYYDHQKTTGYKSNYKTVYKSAPYYYSTGKYSTGGNGLHFSFNFD